MSLRDLWAAQACGVVELEILYDLLSHTNEHVRCSVLRSLSEPSVASQVEVGKLLSSAEAETSNLVRLYWLGALPQWNGDGWWSIAATMMKPKTLDQDRDYPLMLWYAIKDKLVQQPTQGAGFLAKFYQSTNPKIWSQFHFARLCILVQDDWRPSCNKTRWEWNP